MHLFIYIIFLLTISFQANSIDSKADQAIVVDFTTGEILFEKNSNQHMPPASMTKIMTVYVAFDRINKTDLSIADKCIVSSTAYKMGGSRTFLEINDNVTIDDLLKGIIIQSGNDASLALAECLGGTESNFALLMNNYANKLGMNNTNFINSSGWPNKNHYSTVGDLSILSAAIIKDFPNLYDYFKLKEFTYNGISQPNRNKLLYNFSGADGIKTGFTKKSGWGIAGSALLNERRIIVIINGANSARKRLTEVSNLLNWAFSQTSEKKLLSKGQFIKTVDVWLGNKPTINLIIDKDLISILSFDQLQLIETKIIYKSPLSAPIKKGDVVGHIEINVPGKSTLKAFLVSEGNVNKVNPFFKIFAALKYLVFGTSLDEV